jgi:tetratricopeptide (TPR) repeat protein
LRSSTAQRVAATGQSARVGHTKLANSTGLVLLACLLLSAPCRALDPPDHEQWQAHMTSAERAMRDGDADSLPGAMLGLFEQGLRFGPMDARGYQTTTRLFEAYMLYKALRPDSVDALLQDLERLTRVEGALASPMSVFPTIELANLAERDGRFAESREILGATAERAAAALGETHETTRRLRREEVDALAAVGEFDLARECLIQARGVAEKVFGPKSVEYALVVIDTAEVDAQAENYAQALEEAEEAVAILRGIQATPRPELIKSLGDLYWSLGKLEQARLYYRGMMELINWREPGVQTRVVPLLMALATIDANLGEGADARSDLKTAREMATSAAQPPELLFNVLLQEAQLHGFARDFERAAATVAEAERFAAERGLSTPNHRLRVADAMLDAEMYDEVVTRASALLGELEPASLDHAFAADLLIRGSALAKRPAAKTPLAEDLVRFFRQRQPHRTPYAALGALALSYRADGRFREALEIERQVTTELAAKLGEHAVQPSSWERHAQTLRLAGERRAADEMEARVAAERDRFAEGWLRVESGGPLLVADSAFGFSVAITERGWTPWTVIPYAAFTATYGSNSATVSVIPVLLTDDLDQEAAIDALIGILQLPATRRVPWSNERMVGYELRYERTIAGIAFQYLARFAVEEHAVYLMIAGAQAQNAAAISASEAAIEQISLKSGPVDAKNLAGKDREVHASVLNQLGNFRVLQGEHEKALASYLEAERFASNESVLTNIAYVQSELGYYEDLLATIDRFPGNVEEQPELLTWRALARTELDDIAGAIADYERAFGGDYRDDAYVTEYVGLLVDVGRARDAAKFLERYGEGGRSAEVIAIEALVYHTLDDRKRLDAVLALLEDPTVSTPEAALIAGSVHLEREGVEGLAKFAERAQAAGLATAELYAMLAGAHFDLEDFAAAKDAVDRGLSVAPFDEILLELRATIEAQTPQI